VSLSLSSLFLLLVLLSFSLSLLFGMIVFLLVVFFGEVDFLPVLLLGTTVAAAAGLLFPILLLPLLLLWLLSSPSSWDSIFTRLSFGAKSLLCTKSSCSLSLLLFPSLLLVKSNESLLLLLFVFPLPLLLLLLLAALPFPFPLLEVAAAFCGVFSRAEAGEASAFPPPPPPLLLRGFFFGFKWGFIVRLVIHSHILAIPIVVQLPL